MDQADALKVFEALSSGVRLDIFRVLVEAGQSGLVAGELAEKLTLPASNLSFHFRGLVHAGLLTVEQEGRYQRYRANLKLMVQTISFLTEDCCGGHPEVCGVFKLHSIDAHAPARDCGDC